MLAGILLLAAAPRLWGVTQHPFVQDELYTLIDAKWLLDSPLETGIAARPFYYLLQHVLLPIVPETEIGLRVLPFIFGVAGVWATWALARTVFGRRSAVVAAFLTVIAPWHLYISEMARYWSLVYLLVTVFILAYLMIESGRNVRIWGWIALVSLLVGTLTHPTFLFPIVGVLLLDVSRAWRRRSGESWWSRPVIGRVWLPYAAFVVVAGATFFLTGAADGVQERASRGLGASLRLLPAVIQWITPALFVAAAVAVLGYLYSDRAVWRRWGRLALAAGSSTILLLMAASAVSEVYTDYAVGLLPLAMVSLGGIVSAVRKLEPGQSLMELCVVGMMVFTVLPSTVSHVIDGTRFDFRPAFEFIRQEDSEIPVLVSPIVLQSRYAEDLDGTSLGDVSLADLESMVKETAFWVIAPIRRYGLISDPAGDKLRWLVRHCPERASYERPRFDYRMYRVKVLHCESASEFIRSPSP